MIQAVSPHQVFLNLSPQRADMAVVSVDNFGSPGALNQFVLKDYGYSIKDIPKGKELSNGYYLLQNKKNKPILFVVTVDSASGTSETILSNNTDRTTKSLRNNLYKALSDLIKQPNIAQNIWLPLMGTGSGGLSFEESFQTTINVLDSLNYSPEQFTFLISFPETEEGRWLFEQVSANQNPKQSKYSEVNSKTEDKSGKSRKSRSQSKATNKTQTDPEHTSPPPPKKDDVHLHNDRPTANDDLNREPFVKALLKDVLSIWKDNPPDQSFMLHIYGEWGAGKSSVLQLMKHKLENGTGGDNKKWIVVEFNAWEHQRINPPWWPLLEETYVNIRNSATTFAKAGIRARQWWWKYRQQRLFPVVAALILLLFIAVFYWRVSIDADSLKNIEKIVFGIGALSAGFTFVYSIIKWAFISDAENAMTFLKKVDKPTAELKRRFQSLIKESKQPVAIFIDDLDRCSADYVVQLIEGIQTLFREVPVFYVIAADRQWISTCFETIYKDFKGTVSTPGHQLGYHFVEKAFQMSIRLPHISPQVAQAYWDNLLGSRKKEPSEDFHHDFSKLKNEEEIINKVEELEKVKPQEATAIRAAAVERLSNERIVQDQEHALAGFAGLLRQNPRAFKRLINSYSIQRQVLLIEGLTNEVSLAQLARWLIIRMRWPQLADHLETNPDLLNDIDKAGNNLDDDLKLIARNQAFKEVLGNGTSDSLTAKALAYCVGKGELNNQTETIAP